jgi:multidrug resistance efflux pump
MSDREEKPTAESGQAPEKSASASVRGGTLGLFVIILLSLAWYLISDRFTPYTSQARVQGFVVGTAPKVAGVITRVWVRNDQTVEAGEPLFEVDRAQYEIALSRAQSDLESAHNQLGADTAVVESARANLRAAQANELKAKQDASRLERLHGQDPGTISVRRLEVSLATLKQATAQVAAAAAEVQRSLEQKGGSADNNSKLKSALSAVDKAQLDLKNTVIRASSRGVITDLRADVGQFAAIGSPMMTLIAIQDVWIAAEFTENNLGHLQVGSPVEFVLDALPGQVFPGKVKSIGLGVSAGQTQPPGTLPTIDNSRDWLRPSQRFPAVISLEPSRQEQLRSHLRIGGQAEVIAYSDAGPRLLRPLGEAYIRLMSWLAYAY